MREEYKKREIVPYYEQVQNLALTGPSGEESKLVSDMNKGFTQKEFKIIQKHKLLLMADVFMDTMKDPTVTDQILEQSGQRNKYRGIQKGHLSTTKTARKNIKPK